MIKQASLVLFAAFVLAACARPASTSSAPTMTPPAPGSDRDAHGCIGYAGYSWCERVSSCVRPWELAQQQGLAADKPGFDAYCAASAK
jgi:hypothetical protein